MHVRQSRFKGAQANFKTASQDIEVPIAEVVVSLNASSHVPLATAVSEKRQQIECCHPIMGNQTKNQDSHPSLQLLASLSTIDSAAYRFVNIFPPVKRQQIECCYSTISNKVKNQDSQPSLQLLASLFTINPTAFLFENLEIAPHAHSSQIESSVMKCTLSIPPSQRLGLSQTNRNLKSKRSKQKAMSKLQNI